MYINKNINTDLTDIKVFINKHCVCDIIKNQPYDEYL